MNKFFTWMKNNIGWTIFIIIILSILTAGMIIIVIIIIVIVYYIYKSINKAMKGLGKFSADPDN